MPTICTHIISVSAQEIEERHVLLSGRVRVRLVAEEEKTRRSIKVSGDQWSLPLAYHLFSLHLRVWICRAFDPWNSLPCRVLARDLPIKLCPPRHAETDEQGINNNWLLSVSEIHGLPVWSQERSVLLLHTFIRPTILLDGFSEISNCSLLKQEHMLTEADDTIHHLGS